MPLVDMFTENCSHEKKVFMDREFQSCSNIGHLKFQFIN
jgi:hypothetical protein